MRYVFGFLCVCALGVMPLVGCSETSPSLCEGVECEDDDNECTEDVCNPADGTCGVPVDNGTACSTGGCMDGVCTALAAVMGSVIVYESLDDQGSPAAGVTVSVHGASISTTTNQLGQFAFDVPVGTVFLDSSKVGTWGSILLVTVPTVDSPVFEIGTDELMTQVAEELNIDLDETKGWVAVGFNPSSDQGGESATLSELYDGPWTSDADGKFVRSDALLAGGDPYLDFPNVGLTEKLIVTPEGVDGVNSCDLEYPGTVYPVVAKVVTDVEVRCTPL